MFENLTNKFEEIFSSLKKAPSLDEKQAEEGLRGIRQALLEADVSLEVVKEFAEKLPKKKISLVNTVDENIVGGFNLKIGDRMIDCTVSNKLNELRKKLINN